MSMDQEQTSRAMRHARDDWERSAEIRSRFADLLEYQRFRIRQAEIELKMTLIRFRGVRGRCPALPVERRQPLDDTVPDYYFA